MPISKQDQLGSYSKTSLDRRTYLERQCDSMFSKIVLTMHPKCLFTGNTATTCFHFIPRGHRKFRWDLRNATGSELRFHIMYEDSTEEQQQDFIMNHCSEETYEFYMDNRDVIGRRLTVQELEELAEEMKDKIKLMDKCR